MLNGTRKIWGSDPDYEKWRETVEADYPGLGEEECREIIRQTNMDLLYFLRDQLGRIYPENILVTAELGYHGRVIPGYREIRSKNLADCFEYGKDAEWMVWYLDPQNDLRGREINADGMSEYLYRVWKENVPLGEKDRIRSRLILGTCGRDELDAVTHPLGDDIADLLGYSARQTEETRREREEDAR